MKSKWETLGGGASIVGFLQQANIIGFLDYVESESSEGHHVLKLLGESEKDFVTIQYRGKQLIPSMFVINPTITENSFSDAEIVLILNDEKGNNYVFANLVNSINGWQLLYYGNKIQNCSTAQISHDDINRSEYLEETRTILVEIYNQLLAQLPKE